MSDIGLKGVAGFLVIGATALLAALVTLIAAVVVLVVCSRSKRPAGPTLARYAGGPLVSMAIAAIGLAWSWDSASDAVDDVAPLIAFASVLVGVIAAVLLRRFHRVATERPPPS